MGTFSLVVSDGTNTDGSGLSVTVTVVATSVSSGAFHVCARLLNGMARCWGYNNRGQLGDNTTTQRLTPVAVHAIGGSDTLSGVASVSAGGEYFNRTPSCNPTDSGDYGHSCSVLSTGGVVCWGYNGFAALENGTTTSSLSPVSVSLQ